MTVKITREVLDSIQVLYRDPDRGSLYGIPYEMREGQSPTDLWRGRTRQDPLHMPPTYLGYTIPDPGPREGWVWLPHTSYRAHLSEEEKCLLEEFMAEVGDWEPKTYFEWVRRKDWEDDVGHEVQREGAPGEPEDHS